MKLIFRVRWNKFLERYVLRNIRNANVYEIPDCENVRAKYPGLDKNRITIVEDFPAKVIGYEEIETEHNKGGEMEGDRIKAEIGFSYKATNSKGEVTLEVPPMKVIVADQSPAAASAHLADIVHGVLAPAAAQAQGRG